MVSFDDDTPGFGADTADPGKRFAQVTIGIAVDDRLWDGADVADLVIEAAAEKLLERVTDVNAEFRETVRQIRDEIIRERLELMVDQVLAESVRETDSYGRPTGDPLTLTDLVVRAAAKELRVVSDDFYARQGNALKGTVLTRFVRDEIGLALHHELTAALSAGKAEVVKALREKGAEILAQTIKQTVA